MNSIKYSVALVLCLSAITLNCGIGDRAIRPNVVIILVDTLRADHISVDGYERDTTPFLREIASRGTYFSNFHSHSALTRPSVATLFTSAFVSNHGVVNQGFAKLPASMPVMPEMMKENGYRTLAVVTNPQIHPEFGFNRGFSHFDRLFNTAVDPGRLTPHNLVKTPAADVFSSAQALITQSTKRPFFAYIHLLDPHGPYASTSTFTERFVNPGYEGTITGSIEDFSRIAVSEQRSGPDLQHFSDLYDAEIASTDSAIGAFVAWLDNSEFAADTHIFITADHGEELMEHGGTGHGLKLYEETTRVPLLWIGPGIPQDLTVEDLAGLIDILPTLHDVLGLKGSAVSQGSSLVPLLQKVRPQSWRHAIFLEGPDRGTISHDGEKYPKVARSLITRTHKLIARGCTLGGLGWQTIEIFNLVNDPNESSGRTITRSDHLNDGDEALVAFFEKEVRTALAPGRPENVEDAQLPADDIEKLKALGYLE